MVGTRELRIAVGMGLLTLLLQDQNGGLEIRTESGWIDAPPIPGSFVCNIGDMLERMTGGRYRSTPHRVALNTTGRDRLSSTFFFDPNFQARVQPLPGRRGCPPPHPESASSRRPVSHFLTNWIEPDP